MSATSLVPSANLTIKEKLDEAKNGTQQPINTDYATKSASRGITSIDLEPCIPPNECEDDIMFSHYNSNVFAMGVFILVFLIPTLLLTLFYGRIYVEAHNNCKVWYNIFNY